MINELSLLKLNPGSASTKQKIIDLLSNEWPLSAKQIHEKLQRQYATDISYQATHKTLKELEEENTISKENKGYKLEIEWIQKSKNLLEKIEKKYLEKGSIIIPENFQGVIELEFDSFSDLCVSTAELLKTKQLARGSDYKTFICTMEYGWWTFKFKFEHLKLLFDMCTANLTENQRPKNIIRSDFLFSKWIAKQYERAGGISAPAGTKLDIEGDLFVQGNCIIQVNTEKEGKRIIEQYYKKWTRLDDPYKEFGLKPEPKIHSTMRITKNPEMAKYLIKQMGKVFEKNYLQKRTKN